MNSRQRLLAVQKGEKVDRVPFMPTILEYSAKLLKATPSEVARDGKLLEEAHIKAFDTFGHDAVTVGIDIYNIEAEALGCKIKYYNDFSIPGVITHPWENGVIMENIEFSVEKGRIKMILDAAGNINLKIGNEVNVAVGMCGTFSIAVEMAGYENIILDCINNAAKVYAMLEIILEFQKKYSDEIINKGLGITIFESWAAPPLVSPYIYTEFILPFEIELISYLKNKGVNSVPLVIGGDTTAIVDDIVKTGTSMLVADYMVDIGKFVDKASDKGLAVRGNIDPKLIENSTKEEIIGLVKEILARVNGYSRFILGTGVIPYNTSPDKILAISDYLMK